MNDKSLPREVGPSDQDDGTTITTTPMRTPTVAGRKMSAGLRERLKKSGRCYLSPASALKSSRLSNSEDSPTSRMLIEVMPTKSMVHCDKRRQSSPTSSPKGAPKSRTVLSDDDGDETTHHPASCVLDVTGSKPCSMDNCIKSTLIRENPEDHNKLSDLTSLEDNAADPCVKSETNTGFMSPDVPNVSDVVVEGASEETLRLMKQQLLSEVQKKEEALRKLKLVKMYRSKNDLVSLKCLTEKWCQTSQCALVDLIDMTSADPKPTMGDMLKHLGIDPVMLNFDQETDTFS